MNPWQRLVGTRAKPRRVASPGVVVFACLLAVAWLYLGISALTDGRRVQGLIALGLAVASTGLAVTTMRKRRAASH